MMDFLIKHKLINPSQHGFLKARSCLTNLLCFFEEITKWVDEGSPVNEIYLDFQKAFDKVPHQRLILKLKLHGMGNSIIDWIEQWLIPPSHRRRGATAVLVRHKPQWHRHDRRGSTVVPSLIVVAPRKTVKTADLRGGTAATFNMFRRASAVGPTSPVTPEARCYGGACTA